MKKELPQVSNSLTSLARPARLERATCGFVVRRSIHLSYGRALIILGAKIYNPHFLHCQSETFLHVLELEEQVAFLLNPSSVARAVVYRDIPMFPVFRSFQDYESIEPIITDSKSPATFYFRPQTSNKRFSQAHSPIRKFHFRRFK